MERLTKEEVLHVANLAKLKLTEAEVEDFSYKLKKVLNEIEKIQDVKETTDEVMISPIEVSCFLESDSCGEMLNPTEALKNAPERCDNFITVRGVFDE